MYSALLANHSEDYRRKRARHFEADVPSGPKDMRSVAARLAARYPGTVQRRDH